MPLCYVPSITGSGGDEKNGRRQAAPLQDVNYANDDPINVGTGLAPDQLWIPDPVEDDTWPKGTGLL